MKRGGAKRSRTEFKFAPGGKNRLHCSDFIPNPMKQKTLLPKEPMSYKQQRKESELTVKFRIITDVLRHRYPQTAVADKYRMHRNCVGKIIKAFRENISPGTQAELLSGDSFSRLEMEEKLAPIRNKSTAPRGNIRSASPEQERAILKYFARKSVGIDRMWTFIRRSGKSSHDPPEEQECESIRQYRKDIALLTGLTKARLRGIYTKNKLRAKKVRTKNKNVRPLYDYSALACFERLHYDTKDILDAKALPTEIYAKFDLTPGLPVIEWNIMDVKSRFRFIAYSHARTSEFGLHFLLFVIQYIRAHTLNPGMKIIAGTDNGSEFFSGSERKRGEWNRMLAVLNAEIYSYNPGFDVRKNLIERSHKTDDEEFLIPRGMLISDQQSFLREAQSYSDYFNGIRPHSGLGMDGSTPREKLESCGIHTAEKFLRFPVVILEDVIGKMKEATEIIRILAFLKNQTRERSALLSDQRFLVDLQVRFPRFFSRDYFLNAQNVLTEYPKPPKKP